jgi:hypothetical protein
MISSLRSIIASIHHLFFATIALCCGIVVQAWYVPLSTISPLVTTILTLAVVVLSLIQQGRTLLWLLLPGAFLCGALHYQAQQADHDFFYSRHKGYHEKLVGMVTLIYGNALLFLS